LGTFNAGPWNTQLFNQLSTGPIQASSCVTVLSDLQLRVLDRLDNNTFLYTNLEITSALNECVRVANILTGYMQVSIDVPTGTVANRVWYDVPLGILIPLRVQLDGLYLQKTSYNDLGQIHPGWQTQTTATTGKTILEWIPMGLKRFALYPADSYGGEELTVTGVQEPALLVNPNDSLVIPAEYVELITECAAHVLQLKEGGRIFQDSMSMFKRAMGKMKQMSIWQGDRQPFYRPEAQHMMVR
jgi:hypothetical protein